MGAEKPGNTGLPKNPGDLLYLVEHRLVVDLQQARADLLFIHAAVLGTEHGAVLLVAPSGTGKSTTALALAERGLKYLSDELAPVDVERGCVYPYPHALCLKTSLPPAYAERGFQTASTAHVRAEALNLFPSLLPLQAVIFLQRNEAAAPSLQTVSQGRAVAHLFPEILNGLAHPACGLDAALRVMANCQAWLLNLGSVERSADMIVDALANLHAGAAA